MNYETALLLGEEVRELLRPACDRIEIAGGIRRKKAEPHDIEIVCVPKVGNIYGWFGEENQVNMVDAAIILLLEKKVLMQGEPDKAGKKPPCGPRYYRLKYKGEKLDVFCVLPPAQWGVIFVIRTGDAEFSHWLVQQGKPNINVENGQLVMRQNTYFDKLNYEYYQTPEEEDVFRILGVTYRPPEQRIFAKAQEQKAK